MLLPRRWTNLYLISIEGGDGSGKGEAIRLLTKIARNGGFSKVNLTHEPRRHSELGKLAVQAVQLGNRTPLEEAGLFAADRIDHSHTWILPRLRRGELVISDRNVHSSMVYQGVVGEIPIKDIARMNRGAMVPDLVIWIDCDPEKAMSRIKSGTLRMVSKGAGEYFETTEIQKRIRQGFNDLLSGEIKVPAPFDKCVIAGPVLNEGGLDELEDKLKKVLREFLNRRPEPRNVSKDEVDRSLIDSMVERLQAQTRLPGAPEERTSLVIDWLDGATPCDLLARAFASWPVDSAKESDVPSTPMAHAAWSVIGTLSLISTTDVPRLTKILGPVRSVTQRHTQRMVKWLEEEDWIHRQQNHVPFADAQLFKLKDKRTPIGRMMLALWPMRQALASWRRLKPEAEWKDALEDLISEPGNRSASEIRRSLQQVIKRLGILSSGHAGCPIPQSIEQLLIWWRTPPP